MGMNSASSGSAITEINVTPLIDVLLVLLIIFMVIVPVVPKGLDTMIPQPSVRNAPEEPAPRPIVVQVLADGAYRINEDNVARNEVEPKLAAIFATRVEKTLFVRGDESLDYSKVAEAIDFGKQAGVDRVGLITPKLEAGQ